MNDIIIPWFQTALIAGALVYLLIVFYLLKKQKLAVQYAIIWLISGFVLLLFAIFPYIVLVLSDILHVLNPVNFIFLVTLCFVLLILLSLSVAVSGFALRIKRLTQNAALLERRIRELEDRAGCEVQQRDKD